MEQLKRNETIRPRGRAALVVTCLLITLFSAACGPQVIKGRPPFISISGMALAGEKLSAEFDITNQNGIPMTISMIDITVTVNDVELTRENRSFDLVVGANSTEEIQVDELPDDFTRDLLASLQEGELKSLPFDLNGRVMTAEDGSLRFEQKGHLYPVPGRPGQFRSAVTQAKELRRTEKF
jgi:hypothetical protein